MKLSLSNNLGNKIIVFFLWGAILLYFLFFDFNSFILFLVLPPFFGTMLYFAIKKRHISLSFFFILIFISQAINPALFFFNKEKFLNSGNWEVKDFNFDLIHFFSLYINMYVLILFIFFISIFFQKIFLLKFNRPNKSNYNKISSLNILNNNPNPNLRKHKCRYNRYSIYLSTMIIFFAVPLCFYMFSNGIGISTIQPKRLPFKLVGITIYVRMLLIPAAIFYLYYKSNRTNFPTFCIFIYSLLVGLLSLSKGMLLLAILPVVIFSYFDRNKIRFYFSLVFGALLYVLVSEFRQFILLTNMSIFQILDTIYNLLTSNTSFESDQNLFFTFLYAFSDRLYGAQYTILASQFELQNNLYFILDFVLSNTDTLSKVIAFDLFGIPDQSDVVIGVNIGYLNILLLLAKSSLFLIFFLAFFTAFLLTLIEYFAFKFSAGNDTIRILGYVLCFNMIYFLYDGFIGKFYLIILITIIFHLIIILFSKFNIIKR